MLRPKKHLKLDLLKSMPSIDDLKQALDHARKLRGCTIELPWILENLQKSFALAVHVEMGVNENIWTLYEGEGDKSSVLWSAPFTDLSLLEEVISLSLTEIIEDESAQALDHERNQGQPLNQEINPPINTYTNPNNSQVNIPAQNFYSNTYSNAATYPNANGNFPSLPVPDPRTPYVYYYPSYPYPIPMPYPPSMPIPANSVPLQQGMPVLDPNASSSRLPAPDIELLRKQTNHMMGQFLVDSKLIAESTLKTALKLQEMVVANVISAEQAYEAIYRIHHKGGCLDIAQLIKSSPTTGNISNAPRQTFMLLGDLLIKAGIIDRAVLEAILKMQEIVRSGAISKDEACQAIMKELAKAPPTKNTEEREKKIVDLLIRASIISVNDKEATLTVQKKHGGQLSQILISAGKLQPQTYLAAAEGYALLQQNKLKLEQIIIALNYCLRTHMNLNDAVNELGFYKDQ